MARIGPIVLEVQGDEYIDPARINAIIWEGATTSGDTVELRERESGNILWPGRTSDTQTYLGANLGESGLHAPTGFRLTQISSGRLLVYLKED